MLASSVSAISYDDGDILSDSGSLEMSVVDDSDLSASDSIYVDDVGFDNAAINDFPESDSSLATSDLDSAVLSDSQESTDSESYTSSNSSENSTDTSQSVVKTKTTLKNNNLFVLKKNKFSIILKDVNAMS